MSELLLSVRSARAHDIAHRLAEREKRSVASVVEQALQIYEANQEQQGGAVAEPLEREPFDQFWARLRETSATDADLEAKISENRKPHAGIDL